MLINLVFGSFEHANCEGTIKGKIYTRTVITNFRGWYIMPSKGKDYMFVKDEFIEDNYGWHVYGDNRLDETFLEQIAPQLEELSKLGK